ncbi:MAG: N-acetylneuraminate synthase family protein [bacterium]
MTDLPPELTGNELTYVCVDLTQAAKSRADFETLIKECSELSVDAVNVPLYRTDHLISLVHRSDEADRYREFELSREQFQALENTAHDEGLTLTATVYDPELLKWYETSLKAGFCFFHGGDITYRRLLETASDTSLTPVLSTAASTPDEINRGLEWLGEDVLLLHERLGPEFGSETAHPDRLEWLREEFGKPVGLRDCGPGSKSPQAINEATLWVPQLNTETSETGYSFTELESMLGQLQDGSLESSGETDRSPERNGAEPEGDVEAYKKNYRRSLMAGQSISAGATLKEEMIRELRPAGGLPADKIRECIGILVQRPTDPQEMIAY